MHYPHYFPPVCTLCSADYGPEYHEAATVIQRAARSYLGRQKFMEIFGLSDVYTQAQNKRDRNGSRASAPSDLRATDEDGLLDPTQSSLWASDPGGRRASNQGGRRALAPSDLRAIDEDDLQDPAQSSLQVPGPGGRRAPDRSGFRPLDQGGRRAPDRSGLRRPDQGGGRAPDQRAAVRPVRTTTNDVDFLNGLVT
jgi:hypothetical protein